MCVHCCHTTHRQYELIKAVEEYIILGGGGEGVGNGGVTASSVHLVFAGWTLMLYPALNQSVQRDS